jgi:hypothetical protein
MNEIWLLKTHDDFLGEEKSFYNLYGDYTYLLEGYYETLQSQLSGVNIHPTTEESLDAYIIAIALEKARISNIPIPEYKIVTDKTKVDSFPVLGYAMNPFSNNSYIIDNQKFYEHKIKSLTLSGKYLAVVQKLPMEDYRLDTIRCILGKSMVKEYQDFAMMVFKVFKLPLMKIKVIVTLDNYLLSAIEPLDYDTLSINEKKNLETMGEWQK